MSGSWGKNIKLSIFGESHGNSIGIIIDGLPGGIKLDLDYINSEMQRRVPGKSNLSTPRKESDNFEILSGYFNNHTSGTPLCCAIKNSNQHSKDYESIKSILRPGHADYTGFIKYSGFNDYRGAGHFSGRLTAPLVFAGAIAKQVLKKIDIIVGSHIKKIGSITESSFDYTNIDSDLLSSLSYKEFPTIDDEKGIEMKKFILSAKEEEDSVGGIVETAAINLPVGLGSPFFDSVESRLSSIIFSVPAVKGIEFGKGFDFSNLKGSEANDEYYIVSSNIYTKTNNNGGILGGITNGMPLIFRVVFKPTPSIGKIQNTIDISKMENTTIKVHGRHDPCIVHRGLVVIEAVTAITILDLLIEKEGTQWMI
jgi:chorismate synthase